ncbi:hypothetical protein D3C80_1818420 [compost metagenome]
MAVDIIGEAETVYTEGRHHLQGCRVDAVHPPFHPQLGAAGTHIEQLYQITVAMGLDLPFVQAAARFDRFPMDQVRRRPGSGLTIELEHRDGSAGSSRHGRQPSKSP